MVCIPSHLRGRARRDAVAFYLSQLAQGLLAGEFGVLLGHDTVPVRPPDVLTLEISFARKSRADLLSVRLRWSRPAPGDQARVGTRRARREVERGGTGSHPEFTSPSFGRNTQARDSHSDEDNRRHGRDDSAPAE